MRIFLVTPAAPGSQHGNRVTALRWARILRGLGHRVAVRQSFEGHERCDMLLALHAKRSAADIARFRKLRADSPVLLALTGTDLYRDIDHSQSARRSLEIADRLILLQPHGMSRLEERLHGKCHVIYQSVSPPASALTAAAASPRANVFDVLVVGHLRVVKDPFRAAMAARKLPDSSQIRILHLGGSMSPAMRLRAEREMSVNPRYRWLGEISRARTLQRLARARLLVLSSKLEGGANVVSEAIALSTPVISTRVSGSLGLLGEDYPGYFEVGDTRTLTAMLNRVETDNSFYQRLHSWCADLRPMVDPARESASWKSLLASL